MVETVGKSLQGYRCKQSADGVLVHAMQCMQFQDLHVSAICSTVLKQRLSQMRHFEQGQKR